MKQLICTLRDIYYSLDKKIQEYMKGYVQDAPSDDKLYGRKNNNWKQIEFNGVEEAPTDDKKYLRQNKQWVEETKIDTSDLATKEELSEKLNKDTYNTDKESFALKTDLPDLRDYVTNESANSTYAKKSEIPDVSHLATKEEISDMETKSNAAATYQPIGDYATKAQLQEKADISKLDEYLTEADAEEIYAKKGDVQELPIASADTLGGIKVGAGLSINPETGVLNATGGGTADSVDWMNITSKPETFTPSEHTHSMSDIDSLQDTLNSKANESELSNKLDVNTYNTDKSTFATKAELQNKVDKEEGKSLVSDSEIAKLAELKNYDDTDIKSSISNLTETKADKTAISDMATQTWVESKGYLTEHQDISNLATKTELSEGLETKQDKGDYASRESLNSKQDLLVSGVNIKSVNGESILGEGNIELSSSGGGLEDAPSDDKLYGRKNNEWSEIKNTGDILDLTSLNINNQESNPEGESLDSSIIEAIKNHISGNNRNCLVTYSNTIIQGTYLLVPLEVETTIVLTISATLAGPVNTASANLLLITFMIDLANNSYISAGGELILSNIDTTKFLTDSPSDGYTYGRNNKVWKKLDTLAVDISNNITGLFTYTALSDSNYNTIKNYLKNKLNLIAFIDYNNVKYSLMQSFIDSNDNIIMFLKGIKFLENSNTAEHVYIVTIKPDMKISKIGYSNINTSVNTTDNLYSVNVKTNVSFPVGTDIENGLTLTEVIEILNWKIKTLESKISS